MNHSPLKPRIATWWSHYNSSFHRKQLHVNIHAIKIRAKFLCQFALILAFKIGREERGAQLTTDPIHDNLNTTNLMNGSDGSTEHTSRMKFRLFGPWWTIFRLHGLQKITQGDQFMRFARTTLWICVILRCYDRVVMMDCFTTVAVIILSFMQEFVEAHGCWFKNE